MLQASQHKTIFPKFYPSMVQHPTVVQAEQYTWGCILGAT